MTHANFDPDIRQTLDALRRREKFMRENRLLYATLNKPQAKFMDATSEVRRDKLPRRLMYVGCNKGGKTTIGVIRGICLCLGEHPFLPDSHPLRKLSGWRLPCTGLVCGEQLTQAVDKKLVPEYLHWIPKICRAETKKNQQGVIVKITLNQDLQGKPLGSVIHMRSYDSAIESFEGIDMDFIHWDEPPPYKHLVAAERGLMPSDGISFLTFTSLKEPWIKDFADQSIDYGGQDKGIRVVESGDIWQVSQENGGFLTKEAIEEFIKIVPAEEYPTRVLGQWMQSGSVIYSSFRDEEPWVMPAFDVPGHWTKYEAVDPHDAKPTKWLFAAAAPWDINIDGEVVNRLFVIDYLNLPASMTITEMVREVKRKRVNLGYHDRDPNAILLDSRYGIQRRTPLTSEEPVNWKEKLEDAGAGYLEMADTKHGSVEAGHKVVKAYLRPQLFKLEEREVPGLVFFDRCRGLDGPVEAMRKYRYKIDSDKPEEDYKDWADTVRYLASYRPRYIERYGRGGREFTPRDSYAGR